MAPRQMDQESAQRIARARGSNDPFSKRVAMTVRNERQKDKEKAQEETSGKQDGEEIKKEAGEKSEPTRKQSSQAS